ncbi:glycoside hydrolase family 2 protein [bacterium]|nr:glycoside hydrolase family 2 protein [bacterium]
MSMKILIYTGCFSAAAVLLFQLSCSREGGGEMDRIVLDSSWTVSESGREGSIPARVPGCIHTDLLAAGEIDDPFFADNEQYLQWIGERDWVYRTEFEADPAMRACDHVRLVFEGLDTYALVTLNGMLLLRTDNMFRTWSAECGPYLRAGANTLTVRFRSPLREDSLFASRLGYPLPDQRAFTRKAPYQYGWDWGPRFVTCGIWRPVYLEYWNGPRLEDLQIIQESVDRHSARCRAVFFISSPDSRQSRVRLSFAGGRLEKNADLEPGDNRIEVGFSIPDPELWWCNGLGKQHLYSITGTLEPENSLRTSLSRRIGIRTLEVIQTPDSSGSSFGFRLNGIDMFAKGANYIPQDSFLPRVSDSRYRALIESSVDANMNMLRVWGGGIYENDLFYDLCDEAGLLVWQDFIFACAMYPGDERFLETVREEATQNVRRLRNHPCIALWCGNNEIDEAWHNWGWQEQYGYSGPVQERIWNDYQTLFHRMLPDIVGAEDPGRFYWPSSPSIGWGHEEALLSGDMHYWGVWWGKEPFDVYERKVGRFMSEYGFQSMPDMKTIMAFTLPEDRTPDSPAMKNHQKHPFGSEAIDLYMNRTYNRPKDFESYAYVSQLLQARGIGIALEAHRRARPYCRGTLYWQLNDCWPVISWSSVDYYNRWKALHYTARRVFSDLALLPVQNKEDLAVYVSSDRLGNTPAVLGIRVLDFTGTVLYANELNRSVPANSSTVLFQAPLADLVPEGMQDRAVLALTLSAGGRVLASRTWLFVKPLHLRLPAAEITTDITSCREGYRIRLRSETYARAVYLRCDGVPGRFTDNYFDLLPGEEREVILRSDVRGVNLKARLRIVSLVDSYQED